MPLTDKKTYTFNQGADTVITRVSGVNGVALWPNSKRVAWGIENLSTGGALYWKQGTSLDSGSFNGILAPASIPFKGDGGEYVDQNGNWKGAVTVSGRYLFNSGAANVTLYSIWESYHS